VFKAAGYGIETEKGPFFSVHKVSYFIKIVQNSKYMTDLLHGTNLSDVWNATCLAEQLKLMHQLLFAVISGDKILRFGSKGGKGGGLNLRLPPGFRCYWFSMTRATGLPQRVQIPVRTSIPFSTFPLTFPMPVVSEQLGHQTLFSILI
jgi:hypothetical protein